MESVVTTVIVQALVLPIASVTVTVAEPAVPAAVKVEPEREPKPAVIAYTRGVTPPVALRVKPVLTARLLVAGEMASLPTTVTVA